DRDASNEEVIEFIREEADAAFDRTFQVLRTRVNLFGVAQPNIQKLTASDRILVELPGVKNKERVRQLLQGTAKLEFWETYENAEIYPFLAEANEKLGRILNDGPESDSTSAISPDSLSEETVQQNDEQLLQGDTLQAQDDSLAELPADGSDSDSESSLLEQLSEETD